MVQSRHLKHWPVHLPKSLETPRKTIFRNLLDSAKRFPDKPAVIFYGKTISYKDLEEQTKALANYLSNECRVQKGDRVIVDLQSSPQFVISYYAVLSLGALVVPISPMNVADEINHYCSDSGARIAIVSQDVMHEFTGVIEQGLVDQVIVATYSHWIQITRQ